MHDLTLRRFKGHANGWEQGGGEGYDSPLACPSAPGPLEAYAAVFDDLFGHLPRRRNFRAYLHRLLLLHDRHKARWLALESGRLCHAADDPAGSPVGSGRTE